MAYEHNGCEFPSVTTVLGILAKEFLYRWYYGNGIDYALAHRDDLDGAHFRDNAMEHWKDVTRAAGQVGTEVHKLIELHIKGGEEQFPTGIDQAIVNGYNAFLEVERSLGIKWVASEVPVYSHRWGYAGCVDAVAEIGGVLTLVDFKTSSAVYPEHKVQVSAYSEAYLETTGQKIERMLILHLDKETGTPEVVDCTAGHEMRIASFRKLVDYYYSAAARRLKGNPHAEARGIVAPVVTLDADSFIGQKPVKKATKKTKTKRGKK